jgi:hypothetical protein
VAAHLEVHHVLHWADGGGTDLDNLLGLCPFHHDAHHRGEFAFTGDANVPGALAFTAAGGFPIGPGPIYAPENRCRSRSRPGPGPGVPAPALDLRHGSWEAAGVKLDPGRDFEDAAPRLDCERDVNEPRPGLDPEPDDGERLPALEPEPDDDAEPWPEPGPSVAYQGASGQVLQAKWVTFHEAHPLPMGTVRRCTRARNFASRE